MPPRSETDVSNAVTLLYALVGEYVWFVRRSADDILRMDFGAPHLKIREPARAARGRTQSAIDSLERRIVIPTGKWHFFIDDAEWSITTRFYSTKRGNPNSAEADATLRQLDGQRLTKVSYVENPEIWRLEFDLGGSLTMTHSSSLGDANWSNENQWTLFFEDGSYVSYTNGKSLGCVVK